MFLIDFVFVFFVSLVLSLFLAVIMGWRPPGTTQVSAAVSTLFLFVIFLLAVWAAGVWIVPLGPVLWGGYWLRFVLVGLVLALLLLATASAPTARKPRTSKEMVRQAEEARTVEKVFNVFFFVFAVGLIASIVLAYNI